MTTERFFDHCIARADADIARDALAHAHVIDVLPFSYDDAGARRRCPHTEALFYAVVAVIRTRDGATHQVWLADFDDTIAAATAQLHLSLQCVLWPAAPLPPAQPDPPPRRARRSRRANPIPP